MDEPSDSARAVQVTTDAEEARESLPLAQWHRSHGAVLVPHLGFELPSTYGDPDAEMAALHQGLALVDRSQLSKIELLGEDRHRFLNGLSTANIQALQPGSSVYGLLTERKGGVLAEVTVLAHPDRLWLLLPARRGSVIREHLSRFVIADRVEILPLEELLSLSLVGPLAGEALARQGMPQIAPGDHLRVELFDSQVQVLRSAWQRIDCYTLWVPASIAELFATDLLEGLAARPIGLASSEVLRVEAGWPELGIDYQPTHLPQEIGLEAAVDYEKGCYLGQEVIARLHYRGKAARRICPLWIEADEPRVGAELLLEGRACGALSSVARSEKLGGWLGLAMLQRRAEPGQWLELAAADASASGRARIRELEIRELD